MFLKNLPGSLNNELLRSIVFIAIIWLTGCSHSGGAAYPEKMVGPTNIDYIGSIEREFQQSGLVNIQAKSDRFFVHLAYSDTANFLHRDVYGRLESCYLHPETFRKLLIADSLLQLENPNLHFLIFDGARPCYVQELMYRMMKTMPVAQGLYLSHPMNHSLHNYGAAVDLTICDDEGNPVDMGTEFDHFGAESHIGAELLLVQQGKISNDAYHHRILLRRIMLKAGFTPITFEWWHFNSCSRGYAANHYTLLP